MLVWLISKPLSRLQELHTRYYEPLAEVKPSINALLAGLPVKKLLFMTDPARIDALVKPHWMVRLRTLFIFIVSHQIVNGLWIIVSISHNACNLA